MQNWLRVRVRTLPGLLWLFFGVGGFWVNHKVLTVVHMAPCGCICSISGQVCGCAVLGLVLCVPIYLEVTFFITLPYASGDLTIGSLRGLGP